MLERLVKAQIMRVFERVYGEYRTTKRKKQKQREFYAHVIRQVSVLSISMLRRLAKQKRNKLVCSTRLLIKIPGKCIRTPNGIVRVPGFIFPE